MNRIKMPTPYAEVIIEIKKEDLWAKDDIIEWIFHNCGLTTEKDFAQRMRKFEKAKENIKRKISEQKI